MKDETGKEIYFQTLPWLGGIIEYFKDKNDNPLSAAAYNKRMQLPTLAELYHGFFGGSEDCRNSVFSQRGCGEWTSTFLQDGKKAVERPERIVYRNGVWVLEGGKVTTIELPPDGWTLEYDKPTGFPSRTCQKKEDAEKVFGDDTSYFYRTTGGVRAVSRGFILGHCGQFFVRADYTPSHGDLYIGGRSCRRSDPRRKERVNEK